MKTKIKAESQTQLRLNDDFGQALVQHHSTLITWLRWRLLDGEVKRNILVSHEELAENRVLVLC